MQNIKIEYLNVNSLKPYEKNTRKHKDLDVKNIATSIEKYGFNDAIGIWGKDNIIVEGHGRLLAAKKLGMKEVPCVRLDHLTDEQRREYAIAHNATNELSEWDEDMLNIEVGELELDEFDFDFDFEMEENLPAYREDQYTRPELNETHFAEEEREEKPNPFDDELLQQYGDHGEQFLMRKRVIITYDEEQEAEVMAMLGIKEGAIKVTYSFDELRGMK